MTLVVSRVEGLQNATYFANPQALDEYLTNRPGISKIVFVIWSWKVPNTMLERYECYGMHTGPLLEGKGRGGSPIRNLKALGIEWATTCVFKMTPEFDKGQILAAIPICLNGSEYPQIDKFLPIIVSYLSQDNSQIPELFKRLPA